MRKITGRALQIHTGFRFKDGLATIGRKPFRHPFQFIPACLNECFDAPFIVLGQLADGIQHVMGDHLV